MDRLHHPLGAPFACLTSASPHRLGFPSGSATPIGRLSPSTMGEHRSESWYRDACRRWSGIRWPFERYRRHLGEEQPRYPEDLFLGGAAGEREDAAWSVVDDQLRGPVVSRLSRSARGGRAAEDLWGDVVLKMISDDPEGPRLPDGRAPARVIRFRGRSTLGTFFYVAGLRIGIDAHRRREGRPEVVSLEVTPSSDGAVLDDGGSDPDEVDRLASRFVEAFSALPPTRRALLALVHGRGLPKGRAAALLGLKPYQVSRELRRSIAAIRDRLVFAGEGTPTTEVIERCLIAWTRTRDEVENENDFREASP